MNTTSSPAAAKTTNRFRSRSSLAFAAMLLFSASSIVQGQTVTFGNFGPGVDPLIPSGGGSINSLINDIQFGAVAFSVGSQPIEIQSIDLGMSAAFGSPAGFLLVVADQDFPTSGGGPVSGFLQSFSTNQTITGNSGSPARYTFTPDAAFTLTANTTYFLRLQWDNSITGSVNWHGTAAGSPIVLSDYSSYALAYGTYTGYPNSDREAYFITASVIPEASTSALLLGGGAVLLGWFVRKRRSQHDSQTDSQTDTEA